MDADTRRAFMKELTELGPKGVRSELMGRRWTPEKTKIARQWLEREDVRQWQKTPPKAKVGLSATQKRWIGYIFLIAGIGFAATRLFKTFKFG
jgi:hypothetical protein